MKNKIGAILAIIAFFISFSGCKETVKPTSIYEINFKNKTIGDYQHGMSVKVLENIYGKENVVCVDVYTIGPNPEKALKVIFSKDNYLLVFQNATEVHGRKFKTKELLGIGSKVGDFFINYPNYRFIWLEGYALEFYGEKGHFQLGIESNNIVVRKILSNDLYAITSSDVKDCMVNRLTMWN
jgi:hypothetical protein